MKHAQRTAENSSFAVARQWRRELQDARKKFHEELTRIDLAYLALYVLTLNRAQLAAAYAILFHKAAPAKAANLAAEILTYPDRSKILKACRRGKTVSPNGSFKSCPPKRESDSLDKDVRHVFGVLYRLDPETKAKEAKRTKSSDPAYRRAWWARMSPERRKKYLLDQWKRRQARLKADPKAWSAYKEQQRQERANRRERLARDPIAKAKETQKIKERNARYPRREWMRLVKANPVSLAKYKARMKISHRRTRVKRQMADPKKMAALLQKVGAVIPKNFPPEIRDDLRQELLSALISGECSAAELPQIVKRKSTRTRKLLAETWNQRSLDEPIRGTDGLTLLDTLPSDARRF